MPLRRIGIAALVLFSTCALAQVNVVTVANMPTMDAPPHERQGGDIKAHFVRLKSVVHPNRLANFQHDAEAMVSADTCRHMGEPKAPLPTDPDERYLAYEDHYITDRFHVTYLQWRRAAGPCKLKWQIYRKVTIQSFNGTSCVVDLSRPQVARNQPNCSMEALQRAPAASLSKAMRLSQETHDHAGRVCRYIEPAAGMGDLAKLHRRCVMDVADVDTENRAPALVRGLLLRSETRLDPNSPYVDIMEAERVELGVGVSRGVLLPHMR